MMKSRVFISAYACEPGLGSEIGVGWHWVLQMSRHFDLWVLTRESNRKSIEPWLLAHPEFSSIHFIYYDLPRWARWWKKGLRGVRIYYNLWQWATNGIVRQVMTDNNIDIFHHLTYGNALWKVSSYGQSKHFIWGPIGGVETVSRDFSRHYGLKWQVVEAIRRLVVRLLPLNIAFRRRCKNANLIICKTQAMLNAIPSQYRAKSILMTDVASESMALASASASPHAPTVNYIAIGRLDAWRGFDLALEAFDRLADIHDNVHFTIVGKGSDRSRLHDIVSQMKSKDKVDMVGKVGHDDYLRLLNESDVVVNPALREGAVTVIFDSLSLHKPIVCVETGGYTRQLTDKVAHIVPLQGRNEVVDGLFEGMARFYNDNNRTDVAKDAQQLSAALSWDAKGNEIYNAFLANIK